MKRFFRIILWILGLFVLLLLAFIVFSMITEFRPHPKERLAVKSNSQNVSDSSCWATILTWNLGYGGLGEDMDFFYDGGARVRPTKYSLQQSWDGIRGFLEEKRNVDFYLFQEVDQSSGRSHYLDQVQELEKQFGGYATSFAINYHCRFVPVPPLNPMEGVTSGQMIISRFHVDSAFRMGFDIHPGWPGRLFYMKRCFLVNYLSWANGKILVLINVHNSAFDSTGKFRFREMEQLGEFMKKSYEAGMYVVAGGDWNANPPDFDPTRIISGDSVFTDPFSSMMNHLPGWKVVSDPQIPTNRHVDAPYIHGETPTTILDFFVVSPNIDSIQVRTHSLGFKWTDHQPVEMKCWFSEKRGVSNRDF